MLDVSLNKTLNRENMKNEVKELIKALKSAEKRDDFEKVKEQFKTVIGSADPVAIALAENELAREGFSMEDMMSACDIHLMLFKESIDNSKIKVEESHPLNQFMKEHKWILGLMERLKDEARGSRSEDGLTISSSRINILEKIAGKLMETENHNVRQENTLFPVLEKHGIEQPPAVMWAEHSEMKEQKKEIINLIRDCKKLMKEEFSNKLERMAAALMEKFSMHSRKEQHILYVTALEVITENEWKEIKEECDNLGYFEMAIV